MRFFQRVTTIEEAKKLYRKLCFENHPDRGGNTATMQQINAEYDDVMKKLTKETHYNDTYRNIINELINFDLDIEIIGTWVWVTGNTYACKDKLKELGFKWASQKKSWYWHEGEYKKTHKKSFSLDEIKSMHEVTTVKTSGRMNRPVLNGAC